MGHSSVAFDRNTGGRRHVSTTTGNAGTDHSRSYQIFRSNLNQSRFALTARTITVRAFKSAATPTN